MKAATGARRVREFMRRERRGVFDGEGGVRRVLPVGLGML